MNKKQAGKEESAGLVTGYVGTYYSEQSQGIYRFSFDPGSGRMTEPELFYRAQGAKWVSLNGSSMVIPIEAQGRAGSCFLKLQGGKVVDSTELLEEEETPCYILQQEPFVYTANYHDGCVIAYRLEQGKPVMVKRLENGAGAGCHQILLHEKFLMVPCLKQNRVRLFDTTKDFEPAGEIGFSEGCGPRHGVFNRNHSKLYLVSEWSNELFVFQVSGSLFTLKQSCSLLPWGAPPKDEEAAAAAIRLTADESFLYVSIRGIDQLAVFDVRGETVKAIQHISCKGSHPRDFVLSNGEGFLLAANRFEGGLVSMKRDGITGLLSEGKYSVSMPQGVALAWEN